MKTTQYKAGDMVKVISTDVLPSQVGQVGRVLATFSEPNAYTGASISFLQVLVAGRVARVADWEVEGVTA